MRVKVDLQLPYAFETSRDQIFLARIQEQYPGLKGQDLRERAARWLTEDFIVSAAQMVFPGGMGIAEAQPFGKIHSQCGRREMELEKPEFIFLANLFFSEESRKLVRFNAQVAAHFAHWTNYLRRLLDTTVAELQAAEKDDALPHVAD